MNDAFIMNTTFLDSLNPPFFTTGRGSGGRLASPRVGCEACGQPLIETRINHHFVRLCDNYACRLFRERQGIRACNSRVTWPSYPKWLKCRQPERYQRYLDLRAAGLSAILASRYRDMTSMTVRQIARMFQKEGNQ